jgi:hypothetical protein
MLVSFQHMIREGNLNWIDPEKTLNCINIKINHYNWYKCKRFCFVSEGALKMVDKCLILKFNSFQLQV